MSNQLKDFKTISGIAGPVLYREKKSRFIGYAFPVSSVEAADQQLASLRKEHANATHVCYGYRIGIVNTHLRMNDDGEPAYTAGSPILGQITSAGLHDVLVCIVRYYGGVKLGAGGLSKAYKEAAKGVLESSTVIRRKAFSLIRVQFQYPQLEEVMGFISQNRLKVASQKMELDCTMEIVVSPEKSEAYYLRFERMEGVEVQKKEVFR
jgi:uncharacterized YigZ family protein